MVSAQAGTGIGAEEKIRALDEVLRSDTLARSERLKGLLRFLCEAEIDGRESELNEYAIGTKALGRPPEFAPLEDSSVRSRTYELRQKLEKYYEHEAPSAAIRIELRKGSYVPRFSLAKPGDLARTGPVVVSPLEVIRDFPSVTAPRPVAPSFFRKHSAWVAILAFAGGAAVMFAALAIWSVATKPGVRVPATRLETAVPTPSQWTPELEAFWRPFLARDTPLLIAFETRFFVRMGPLAVRDWHVNDLAHVENSEPLMRVKRLFDVRQLYESRNYTDSGTPQAIFHLTRLLSPRSPAITVKSSLDFTADDFGANNVILVGKPWTDPQIGSVLSRAELVDDNGKITNVHPAPGELAEYKDQNDSADSDRDRWSVKYAVISVMPSPVPGRRILALTSSASEYPSALAYYLTNPDTMRELFRRMRPTGIPEYFQVLVRAEFKSKTHVKVDYVTHRTWKVR